LQLTRVTGVANMEYHYSPNQNNGQITQQKDWNTGEEVTYTYDSLQRLIGAVTTDPSWARVSKRPFVSRMMDSATGPRRR
jgi:YD repeat-containing protein